MFTKKYGRQPLEKYSRVKESPVTTETVLYVVTHLCKCAWKEPTDLPPGARTERQETTQALRS